MVGPKRIEIEPGKTVHIHCRVDSDALTTQVTWFRNSLPVVNGPSTFIYSNNTLELQNVGSNDRGVYKCVATNTMGQSYDDASVLIQGKESCTCYARDVLQAASCSP